MVSFNLRSVYGKTKNEVGITISKLYFWISLSEMIQENRLGNMPQTKSSAKIILIMKSWEADLIDGTIYIGLKRIYWSAESKILEG